MPYMKYSKEYEDRMLESIKAYNRDLTQFLPSYLAKEAPASSGLLCYAIEAMVARSEAHMGKEWDMLITPFAEYLHDKYGVDAVDCEFLSAYHYRSMVRRGEEIRDNFLERYGDYIDYEAYEADHELENNNEEDRQ